MSRIWCTSDSHFGNESIIKYCGRPFLNSDEQTEALISEWNTVIAPKDTVIHCGDFIMNDPRQIHDIVPRLNGNIILVRGNHDTEAKLRIYRDCYADRITIKDIHYESFHNLFFIFCHFPMTSPEFLDMVRKDNSEVVIVHGHTHNSTPFFTIGTHVFNVSVDVTDFRPIDLKVMAHLVINDFQHKGVWNANGDDAASS